MKKKYNLIIGLGLTGLSVAEYYAERNIPFMMMDSREEPPKLTEFKTAFPDVPLYLGHFDEAVMLAAKQIILSPGLSPNHEAFTPVRAHAIPLVGDVELFAQTAAAPIIAITGTNGKGTVTTLVGEILSVAGFRILVGGNIGTPVLELLKEPAPDFYVLELSSAQLQVTHSLKPAMAALLNIQADHEDYHKDFSEYVAAKHRIYAHAQRYLFNRDDPLTEAKTASVQHNSFGLDQPNTQQFGISTHTNISTLCYGKEPIIALDDIKLVGQHNVLNALAACAIVQPFIDSWQPVVTVLREFQGLNYRCQWIRTMHNVTWYNDSKGANTAATVAAIQRVAVVTTGRLVLILGGIAKQADLSALQPIIASHVALTIVFGRDAKRLAALCEGQCECHRATDLAAVVHYAHQYVKPNDAVLFSPACASFDMFENAEQRGAKFTELVQELAS